MVTDEAIARCLLDLAARRGPGKTICPSEAARAIAPDDWRPLMPRVRAVAAELAKHGSLAVTQGGQPASVDASGPIRLGLPGPDTA